MRAPRTALDWTREEQEALIEAHKRLGCYMEHGTAKCIFCRPDDRQLRWLMKFGAMAGQNLYHGRHIYSWAWWSESLRDSLALARDIVALMEPDSIFAYHYGKDVHVFRKKRRPLCQPLHGQ